jgi:replicative DNA helicase
LDTNDRVAPNSIEAEEAVLGSILINPEAIDMVAGFLTPADFWRVDHGWIFQAMLALKDRGDAIDNITLIDELQKAGRLEDIHGPAKITELVNHTPTHIHAETYARLVERAAVRRRGITACGDIVQSFLEENSPLEEIIHKAHDALTEATKIKQNGDFVTISEFASSAYDHTEKRFTDHGDPMGIPTGLRELDAALVDSGWRDGELIIIAARPSMGKTALALGTAVHAAKQGMHVAFISKEMTGEELTYRMMAGESNINSKKLKSGDMTEDEFYRFSEVTGRVSEFPIRIDDSGISNIQELVLRCRRLHREWHIDLLVVDYLQLLFSESKKVENRNMEVSVISRSLKQLALELRRPVIALSQLSRKVEERKDKRPMMSDLRDSGSLEQDADTVIFIYRDEFYNAFSECPGEAELIIAKQRNGERMVTNPVRAGWIGNITKFVDLRKDTGISDAFAEWNNQS